jgi:competence protein ComEA
MVVPPRATPASGSALLTAILTAVFIPSLSAQSPPTTTDVKFPEGPGKTALFKVCRDCHGPESAVGQLKTHDEWNKTLDEMAANGAQGTDEEWNQILEYLDRNFSLILVNKAGATELATMLDVPRATAEAIVKYRDERGRFGAIDDLKRVPGLDAAKVEARKDRFVF